MRIRTIAGAAVFAAVVIATSGGAAMAAEASTTAVAPVTRTVPAAVQVPPGQVLIGDFLADGVQVYRCTGGAWTFLEPAANLIGWTKRPSNLATAVHFRGPSWESAEDGSLVEAKVIASSPVPGSIPELLLQATKNRGEGAFTHVSFIQRLNTHGGGAPTGSCTDGQATGVKYRAEYRFYVPAS